MSYTLLFHPLSEEKYLQSYRWYSEQQLHLGNRFEVEVESLLQKISDNPEFYSFSQKPYREAKMKDFPFIIVYKINKRRKEVYISAIFHTSRDPKKRYR